MTRICIDNHQNIKLHVYIIYIYIYIYIYLYMYIYTFGIGASKTFPCPIDPRGKNSCGICQVGWGKMFIDFIPTLIEVHTKWNNLKPN